ncbi:TnsD family Tn7-like transposition protein [Brevibacillus daliensis]|uniref:TnsD family Tn7-like transposition protein n=1 Tax=Brevibacillus daliensis TaxID=2892995 RepID=UPI001E507929|nr:TnsD family Tn7-like transposition protein [Brevibacillus daliensis]
MLSHFPVLFQDELLYSGIARYHLISGNSSQKQTINDLFGDKSSSATVDLPSSLKQLSQRLREHYSIDTLIRKHTIYPYYTAFLTERKAVDIYNLMSGSSLCGEVHVTLGLSASLIKSPRYLKFCKVCYKENILQFNEPYWHRSHQLPGVYICHIHKCPLTETEIFFTTRERQFEFVPLVKLDIDQYRDIKINLNYWDHLLMISEQSARLMSLQKIGMEPLKSYTTMLSSRRYITPGGRFRFVKLIHGFYEFYTEGFLQYLNCTIDSSDSWFHKMLRGQHEIFHPLRHLLMHKFLDLEITEQLPKAKLPFGKGPWPCLNKIAEHYGELIIDHCTVTRCSKTGLPIGTFSCSCGFIYSRSGPDKTHKDIVRIGRIKQFGHVWNIKFNQLYRQNMSLRAKASLLGVDPGTVKRKYDQLVLMSTNKEKIDTKQELSTRRERFMVSVKEANLNNIPIRNLNARDYLWLYRHDRTWLLQVISDNRRESFKRSSIIDWQERDKRFLHDIKQAVFMIKNVIPPQRVTMAAVIRNINRVVPVALDKCLNKLPETKSYLDTQIETTEQFQIRRLEWAAEEISSNNLKIQGWRLLKVAGINKPLRKRVEIRFFKLINGKDSFLEVNEGG